MNYTHKKIAAALLSLLIIGGTAPVLGRADVFRPVVASAVDNATVTYDEDTHVLTIGGEIENNTLDDYKKEDVKTIVAEKGTVLKEYVYYLFSDFGNVEKIDLSNADGSLVKYANGMFYKCSSLKELRLCNFDAGKLADVSYMFYKCSSLESLDLSKLDTSYTQKFNCMFEDCTSLKELDASCLSTSSGINCDNMFSNCSVLKTLDLSSWDFTRVQNTDYMFRGCSSLESLDLSGLTAPELISARSMFNGCKNLSTLDLSGFSTPKLENAEYMFANCSGLENIDLSGLDTSKVKVMSSMFEGCSKIKELDISTFRTPEIEVMGSMFAYCTALEDLDISNFDTSKAEHVQLMFYGDKNLKYIDFSNFNFNHVNSGDFMFKDCDTLAPYISTINGASISLDGDISVNYYVTIGSSASKAVLIGPKGAVLIDDLASCKRENGSYKFSYPVNAVQMSDEVTLKIYSDDGKQHIILKSSGKPASYAKGDYSVRSYVADSGKYLSDTKLTALVEALNNYGYAAENYFFDKGFTVSGVDGVGKSDVEDYKPAFGTDPAVSLVLGSETSLRFYTDVDNVRLDDAKATAKTGQFGRYYEIKNIPAHELLKPHKLTVGGNEYMVTPMAYVYRVLNNSAASDKLKEVAKAIYVYAQAANAYNS